LRTFFLAAMRFLPVGEIAPWGGHDAYIQFPRRCKQLGSQLLSSFDSSTGNSNARDPAGVALNHFPLYAVPERRTKFANRAALHVDDARTTGFVILRLTTRKASDAIGIVLSSALF
jgi:hypothetical protein